MTPQRSFTTKSDIRSISFIQKPDITIARTDANGAKTLFLLDPKYKLDSQDWNPDADPRPKKEDIDKMHSYRDAIRLRDGRRASRYAAILYPGPNVTYELGLEALSVLPGAEQQFRATIGGRLANWLS